MEEESTKVRQINEVCALKAIYGDDLIKLNSSSSWSPTEIKLRVYPAQASRGDKRDNCSAVLHIKCSENYPNEVPEFKLEEVKGLQHKLRNQLANELQELAKRKCGEVVIFDFAQHVQMFLHDHNQPGFESFYDEMLSRRTTSQQAELQDRLSKNAQEREALLTQIKEQRDILKAKVRKASHRDDGSNTEIKSMGMYMPTDEQCHCSTISNEIAYRGQRIRCYQCLGPSSVVGCCRRNGVLLPQGITNGDGDSQNKEQNTYENFFIRTWYRCLNAVDDNVASTTVNQVRAELRKLSRICHPVLPAPSLIQADLKYVQSIRRHIPGVSVKYFIDSAISSVNLTKIVARGVLEALSILHSDDLCHGSLRPSCIIIEDKCAIVGEVADAVLINLYHLQKGINKRPVSQEKDLSALCRILRKLLPQNLPPDAIDFLTRFSGADRWSAKQLCEHPWLTIEIETAISHYNEDEDLSESSDSETEELENMISSQPARSRLREDFDIIKWLGRGAFGDVYKARNKLDGALYAIKCVKLDLKRPQFCRKITKEVKFVARLCHDNVVRYYNAWVEEQNEPENKSQKRSISEENDSLRLPQHDSEDDWFAFEGSDENDSGNENLEVEIESADDVSLSVDEPQRACLYIQMELCSKATLRRAIDKQSLNENRVRAWRLFTEIVNGLAHVHARGMIHRDLKPGNIFLDVNDRVKIGDFGLATTRVAPAIETIPDDMISESKDSTATSLTGNVGTFLYAAPELNRSTRVAYNQKVDIYSLGIILFEMFHPAFGTGSERIKVLANLRNETIIVPNFFQKPELHNVLDLVRWCVNHNADSRPTCSELLSNECFRGQEPKVEAVHERSAPIIASALAGRVLSAADRAIFDTAAGKRAFRRHTATLELVKDVCVNTFRLFGARELSAPLLLPPALPGTNEEDGCVRLVMSSGAPARLPCELHSGLSRLPALGAGEAHLRRYSLDRVYRQRSGGLHPQERLQAAFDILTLDAAFPWADAEVLAATCKVLQSLGLHNGSYLRIGHTDLSASALAAAKLPPEVCSSWVWSHRHQAVSVASQPLQEENKQLLRSLLTCEVSLEGLQNSGTGGALRSLARRRDDSGHRAREALHQIQLFIEYAQSLGMDIGIRVGINIPHTIDQSGVIWELVQSAREARGAVLACGGRYDGLMRREADGAPHINHSLLHAVGASLDIEKISELTGTIADNATVAIMISADHNVKSDSMTRSANLARILREANIPVQILEGDLQSSGDQTKNIQCTWESGRWIVSRDFDMRQCREDDVVNTLSGMLRQKCHSVTVNPSPQHKRSMTVLPVAVSVSLVGVDHNAGLRRRCEEAASANAKRALQALGVNPKAVHVLAIDASAQLVRSLVAELDPVPPFNADKAIHRLCDAYPRQRNILTAVEEALSMKMSQPTVIAFYSIKDNICKFLL